MQINFRSSQPSQRPVKMPEGAKASMQIHNMPQTVPSMTSSFKVKHVSADTFTASSNKANPSNVIKSVGTLLMGSLMLMAGIKGKKLVR